MSLLTKLNNIFSSLGVPVETGIFSDAAPETYAVLIPLSDTFDVHADNTPGVDIQEVRIALFSKRNYGRVKDTIICAMLAEDITITSRQYIGYEADTGYHHYNVDAADYYEMEE